jgi:hypothetical protein
LHNDRAIGGLDDDPRQAAALNGSATPAPFFDRTFLRPLATLLVILAAFAIIATGVWLILPSHPRAALMPAAAPHAAIRRPNVLLISIDTVRPDHLSLYGYAKKTSPNLASDFAQPGSAVFTRARSQAPWTLPSHMSLLTSMLPSHNGVDNINQVLPETILTLPQVLQTQGYRTAALVNTGQMRAHWGFNRGFDEWREFAVDTPEGACDNITNEAINWLRKNTFPLADESVPGKVSPSDPRSRPFFLFVHYYDAHDPYEAPEEFQRAMGATLTGAEARALATANRTPEHNLDAATREKLIASYDAQLAWLDKEVGRLLSAAPPDTLVVLFSDHGEAFEEHGWTLHGATLYDEETRVVLAMKFPGLATPARTFDEPVMLLTSRRRFSRRAASPYRRHSPAATSSHFSTKRRSAPGSSRWRPRPCSKGACSTPSSSTSGRASIR